MLHTIGRAVYAATDVFAVLLVFGLFGLMASLASNTWMPLLALELWAGVFFAPGVWMNRWEDYGD